MVGTTISHYKVIEKIGQGGMGEVYRAEDTNLSRDVAIKVLPEQFTKDPQRLARFEREAKLLASLNHPNIAAIYGFEEADDVRFLAMELVPGETLAERVAKGPVPVMETLEICRQIAEGVEAAHEKGVIHRDLKPANVKVTPEGKVKILDFGLAKAFEDEIPAADISQSPTLTEEMTRAGVILGTAAYMSPEQARGEEVDKRTDIFAFGCVLYELLTGKRTFGGKTVTDTLAKVLEGVPNWKVLPRNTPWRIQELLRRCLTKDPHDRLPHIANVRIEIKLALEEPATESPTGTAGAVQPAQQRWGIAVGLVLGAVVAGLAFWLLIQPSPPEQPLNRFIIRPSPSIRLTDGTGNELAISPNGRHVVYRGAGDRGAGLYLRSLDDFVDREIPGTASPNGMMFFSPDGESLGFFQEGKLKRISLAGGSPITLCDAPPPTITGDWLGNTIVFTASLGSDRGLYRVSSNGGEPEMLATVNRDEGEDAYLFPQFLPDEKTVLFTIAEGGGYQVALLSLETGERKVVLENAKQARYLSTGHLIYEQAATGNLTVVPFDLDALDVIGDSVPVVQQVRQNSPGFVDYAISDSGTLVYIPGSERQVHEHILVWVNRDGQETVVTGEKRAFTAPRISPDGKSLAMSVGDQSGRYLAIYDFETDSLNRLTFEDERSGSHVWSPDSKWLIYQSGQVGGESGIVRQPVDGSLPQERLTTTTRRQMPHSWSPDGQYVAFTEDGRPGNYDIAILTTEGEPAPQFIISSEAGECCPQFSPDGKWLAYPSNELGRNNVYVSPFPEPNVKWLVSIEEEGGEQPVWHPNGKEIFYRSGNRMMVASVQAGDQALSVVGRPEVLFEGSYVSTHSAPQGYQYYAVSPDGSRFLMLKEGDLAETQAQINVVLNWFEELKRLVPTN